MGTSDDEVEPGGGALLRRRLKSGELVRGFCQVSTGTTTPKSPPAPPIKDQRSECGENRRYELAKRGTENQKQNENRTEREAAEMWAGTTGTGTKEGVRVSPRHGPRRPHGYPRPANLAHLPILLLLLARRCYRPSDVDTAVRVFCFLFRRLQDLEGTQ